MSEISSYFEGDVKYEYGILILQEELKADIGYFTAMTSDEFNKCFEWENGKRKNFARQSDFWMRRRSAAMKVI